MAILTLFFATQTESKSYNLVALTFLTQKVLKVLDQRIVERMYTTTMFRVDEIQTRQVIY